MKELYDDSKFHDISFEEFQEMVDKASEIEIPLESFQDFVDELTGYDNAVESDVLSQFRHAEFLIFCGKYNKAFEYAYGVHDNLPQSFLPRMYKVYDTCAEHNVLDANILMADYFYERWDSSGRIRGQAFIYLERLYEIGYLPYCWRLGYCYMTGLGTEINKEKAKNVLTDGFLYYKDMKCAEYLRQLIPRIDDALEDGAKLFWGMGCEQNYRRAFDLLFNAALYDVDYSMGYCFTRMADIMMQINIGTSRKAYLLYKMAVSEWFPTAPEIDEEFCEDDIFFKVGKCFLEGYGVQQDYFKAAWYFNDYLGYLKEDDPRRCEIVKLIKDCYAKVELMVSDDEVGDYYKECLEAGDLEPEYDYEEDDDAFLYA